ncbi:thioredoxin-dependent thiol peroxidase [Rhodoligotrophos defluvii]|uniref:thioredoxin-dependent thiol peroxidase n=1 Tax=Rhodoligotrophos defluvii TaxID=2561934 RepID=UPI0010C945ED|nr:thioredoxin-dependent thiol peroxidase [Rhodoligotrophos defluvii]
MPGDLKEGSAAPHFSLPGDGGRTMSLGDFAGRKLVLYFYPRDDTPGCTREAIEFSAAKDQFEHADTALLGISADPVEQHEKFKRKHSLSIPLASDVNHSVLEDYGVWREKSMYGRTFMGIERSTFVIDRSGIIAKIWRNVRVEGHVSEVLAYCRAMD